MLKKISLPLLLLGLSSTFALAGNEAVVGNWDCNAYVDMNYPFVMTLSESEGNLTGVAKSAEGALPMEAVQLDGNALTFKLAHPEAGDVDFKTTVSGNSIEGTLANYSFQGTVKCQRPSSE